MHAFIMMTCCSSGSVQVSALCILVCSCTSSHVEQMIDGEGILKTVSEIRNCSLRLTMAICHHNKVSQTEPWTQHWLACWQDEIWPSNPSMHFPQSNSKIPVCKEGGTNYRLFFSCVFLFSHRLANTHMEPLQGIQGPKKKCATTPPKKTKVYKKGLSSPSLIPPFTYSVWVIDTHASMSTHINTCTNSTLASV